MEHTSSLTVSELLDTLDHHAIRLGDPDRHFTIGRNEDGWEIAVFTRQFNHPVVQTLTVEGEKLGFIEVTHSELVVALGTAIAVCASIDDDHDALQFLNEEAGR